MCDEIMHGWWAWMHNNHIPQILRHLSQPFLLKLNVSLFALVSTLSLPPAGKIGRISIDTFNRPISMPFLFCVGLSLPRGADIAVPEIRGIIDNPRSPAALQLLNTTADDSTPWRKFGTLDWRWRWAWWFDGVCAPRLVPCPSSSNYVPCPCTARIDR